MALFASGAGQGTHGSVRRAKKAKVNFSRLGRKLDRGIGSCRGHWTRFVDRPRPGSLTQSHQNRDSLLSCCLGLRHFPVEVLSTLFFAQKAEGLDTGRRSGYVRRPRRTPLRSPTSPTTHCRKSRRTTERCRVCRRLQPHHSPSRHSVRRCTRRSSRRE